MQYFNHFFKVLSLVIFMGLLPASANAENRPTLQSYQLVYASPESMQEISRNFEIEHRDAITGFYEVLVSTSQTELFLSLAPTSNDFRQTVPVTL